MSNVNTLQSAKVSKMVEPCLGYSLWELGTAVELGHVTTTYIMSCYGNRLALKLKSPSSIRSCHVEFKLAPFSSDSELTQAISQPMIITWPIISRNFLVSWSRLPLPVCNVFDPIKPRLYFKCITFPSISPQTCGIACCMTSVGGWRATWCCSYIMAVLKRGPQP